MIDLFKKWGAYAIIGAIFTGLVAVVPPMAKSIIFLVDWGEAKAKMEARISDVEKKAEGNYSQLSGINDKLDKLIKINCAIAIETGKDASITKRLCL